jgi:hypothetical protein
MYCFNVAAIASSEIVGRSAVESGCAPEWNLQSHERSFETIKQHLLPAPIIKLEKNIVKDAVVLSVFLEAFEATNIVEVQCQWARDLRKHYIIRGVPAST